MTLLISRKEDAATDPKVIPTCFRQVENWANNLHWQAVTFSAGWANSTGGQQVCQYLIDPFGFVNYRGLANFAGTVNNGTISTILTIPPLYAPLATENWFINTYTPGSGTHVNTNPGGTITLINNSGANLTNFNISLSGIRYTTF